MWVSDQRQGRETMDSARKARLEALGWWVWSVPADEAWCTRFDELVAYYAQHRRFPLHSTPVGTWVKNQRSECGTMCAERKAKLEALGLWRWSVPIDQKWSDKLGALVSHYAMQGSIPASGGLSNWVNAQRTHRSTMSTERKAILEALEWWEWDAREDAWSTRYDELVSYHAEHGRLPASATPLRSWVSVQRHARVTMSTERKARLEALPWWVWDMRDAFDDAWNTHFNELVAFYAEHGRFPPATGGIGSWVATQRASSATMDAERKAQLESLNWWAWSVRAGWDAHFDELVAYHEEHSRLPLASTRGLGKWVTKQRWKRETMTSDRKARLQALPWWVWDARVRVG